jgi:hypothetical protein
MSFNRVAVLSFLFILTLSSPLSKLKTRERVLSNESTELAKSIATSIQNNLKLKNFMSQRLLKKLAFDANRAKWIIANELELDDNKRNEKLAIFSQLKQKLIKHSVYADFEYPQIKY